LIQSYQEQITVSKIKKFYSLINQSYQLASIENPPPQAITSGLATVEGSTKLYDYFKPYLKIIKDCGFEAGCFPNSFYKNLNGTDSVNFITRASKNYMVILNDGSAISFMLERIEYVDTPITQLGIIYYDINGPKPPNTFGKDIFQVHITPEGIKLPDYMKMSQKMERCYETGYSCMGWVIKYGNLDYLHCDDLEYGGKISCK